MTPEQYWHGDVHLLRAYRKAEELRLEKENQKFWLQGMYIYDALCAVSVRIPQFGKKKIRPLPYPKEPYPLKSQKARNAESDARRKMENIKAKIEAFATMNNAKFRKQKGGSSP